MQEGHEAVNPIHKSMEGKLDPEFVDLYNTHLSNTPNGPIDLSLLRKNYSTVYSYASAKAPNIKSIKDITILSFDGTKITVRIYKPNDTKANELLPVHIDFHGGGWGLGDLNTEAHILKHYVDKSRVAVADVDYRLVPETPFPAGLKDSFEAVKYIYNNAESLGFKKSSISIGGVSAGGNIALAIDHLCKEIGIKLVLVCAGTPQISDIQHLSKPEESPYLSMKEFQFAPTLNWARLKWFDNLKWSSYKDLSADQMEGRLQEIGWFKSIIEAPNWKGLTKTLIFTAGCDPMRDEGEAYGNFLKRNGNEVVFHRFPGVPHPFMHMDKSLSQAKLFIDMTSRELALAHRTITC